MRLVCDTTSIFYVIMHHMSQQEISSEHLITLARIELNLERVEQAHCPLLCDKLFEYAGKDGHAALHTSTTPCVCKLQAETTTARQQA